MGAFIWENQRLAKQINPRSLGSWCIKESFPIMDSSVSKGQLCIGLLASQAINQDQGHLDLKP